MVCEASLVEEDENAARVHTPSFSRLDKSKENERRRKWK
jgi:hypothetical protein